MPGPYPVSTFLIALAGSIGFDVACAQQPESGLDTMIRHLQPSRTRSLARNLTVESGDEPRAALSLMIRFDFGSAIVRDESLNTIDTLAKALNSPQLAGSRFAVEGHTDAAGAVAYNLKLSELRARAVRDILVERGVEPQRLVASGKGASEPANVADPLAPENRRVRIVNLER